ncbi:MAG: hypothetical protein V4569_06845 [Pseudomonadota bacterium]
MPDPRLRGRARGQRAGPDVDGTDFATTIAAAAAGFANDIGLIVDQLQAAGAQHIVVWNTPNLGLAPAVVAGGGAQLGSFLAGTMNGALAVRLNGEAGVSTFDLFGLRRGRVGFVPPQPDGCRDLNARSVFSGSNSARDHLGRGRSLDSPDSAHDLVSLHRLDSRFQSNARRLEQRIGESRCARRSQQEGRLPPGQAGRYLVGAPGPSPAGTVSRAFTAARVSALRSARVLVPLDFEFFG